MASLNKVILIGNLTANPEVKQTTSGIAVCSFNIAVNRPQGKDKPSVADFIPVVAWRGTAEFVGKYFSKGKPILICGSVQSRSYEDKNNNKRTVVEVVADEVKFVGGKTEEKEEQVFTPHFEAVSDEDDLPF